MPDQILKPVRKNQTEGLESLSFENLTLEEALAQKKLRKDWLIDPSCQFYQAPKHFCSNTDTALLAQFVKVPNGSRVLEIGCNNGALLCYLDRYAPSLLCGVEILEDPAKLAAFNCSQFIQHPWKIVNGDIRNLGVLKCQEDLDSCSLASLSSSLQITDEQAADGGFDVVCSNPPFFTLAESGQRDRCSLKDQGRIEYHLTLHELIENAARLMAANGRFFLVHRTDRLDEIMGECHQFGLHIRRMQMAVDERDGQTKSVLIEAAKRADETIHSRTVIDQPVIIARKGILSWSAWIESIQTRTE